MNLSLLDLSASPQVKIICIVASLSETERVSHLFGLWFRHMIYDTSFSSHFDVMTVSREAKGPHPKTSAWQCYELWWEQGTECSSRLREDHVTMLKSCTRGMLFELWHKFLVLHFDFENQPRSYYHQLRKFRGVQRFFLSKSVLQFRS